MKKQFINEDFVLSNDTARELYHGFSKKLPIIDFHSHLSPEAIATDHIFDNIGEIWLGGDHYKWRAMRINGIDEKYCSGDASYKDKFMKWAETVPYAAGNPLYHWTQLELSRYFGIDELLSPDSAEYIYEQTSEILRSPEYSTVNLLKMMNVEMVGTTDDPVDSLEHHKTIKNSDTDIKVLPTFRADAVLKTEDPAGFIQYIQRLSEASDIDINSFETLVEALDKRHAYFHENGCRLSDSGPERFFLADYTDNEVSEIFIKLLAGKKLNTGETEKYKTAVMAELSRMNHKRGWVQQFHVGALRNNNTRKFLEMGPDTGWDSIGNTQDSKKMSGFLDLLDKTDQLAKTILYNLNPADNEMMITMCGNFSDGTTPAKVTYGAAWWFLDHISGMEKHLKDLSALGLLSRFIGMVTDSRSFLSFPRHEYFRRIVCNHIGNEVEKGLIPNDESILKMMVENISYYNAKNYFNF
jgi:glucuronate isomerase